MRIAVAVIASALLTLLLAAPAAACLAYVGAFGTSPSEDLRQDRPPDLLLVARAVKPSHRFHGGPIGFVMKVESVVRGEAEDRITLESDSCTHAPFRHGETVVLASWGWTSRYGTSDFSDFGSSIWISVDGQSIDQSRSPPLNGVRAASIGELIQLLDSLPDSAMRPAPPLPVATALGAILSAVGILCITARTARRVRRRSSRRLV